MIVSLYNQYGSAIRYNKKHMNSFNLRVFNDAINRKGSPYDEVVGFIDGIVNVIARPTELQESVYNGHYWAHALKYQEIVTPDGFTVSLCGSFAGTMHDLNILDSSNFIDEIKEQLDSNNIGGKFYVIYGDPAYSWIFLSSLLNTRQRWWRKPSWTKI